MSKADLEKELQRLNEMEVHILDITKGVKSELSELLRHVETKKASVNFELLKLLMNDTEKEKYLSDKGSYR